MPWIDAAALPSGRSFPREQGDFVFMPATLGTEGNFMA
jgi:hypothetical protein